MNLEKHTGMNVKDQTLECADCGTAFIFTEGEQRFFATKGFPDPRRCRGCRNAKRLVKASVGQRAPWAPELRAGS